MSQRTKDIEKNISVSRAGLLRKGFFAEEISVDVSRIFPMAVIATMSSGKSTLINALIENDILPNKNEACTAKVFSILDDDSAKETTLFITKKDKTVLKKTGEISQILEEINDDKSVDSVLISGEVKGVLNTDKSLLIIDTPGPNNSRDERHSKITENLLKKLNGGLILYVINATQMGINDDRNLLSMINEFMKKHSRAKVVFVINKIDMLDLEIESIEELMMVTKQYLESNGIENPDIIPVSALAASLFKKVLQGKELTRSEYRNFAACYELFEPKECSLPSYMITEEFPDQYEKINVRDEKFTKAQIRAAIDNTGIRCLERYIQNAQIKSGEKRKVNVRIKR